MPVKARNHVGHSRTVSVENAGHGRTEPDSQPSVGGLVDRFSPEGGPRPHGGVLGVADSAVGLHCGDDVCAPYVTSGSLSGQLFHADYASRDDEQLADRGDRCGEWGRDGVTKWRGADGQYHDNGAVRELRVSVGWEHGPDIYCDVRVLRWDNDAIRSVDVGGAGANLMTAVLADRRLRST